jgi:hypothetical protein
MLMPLCLAWTALDLGDYGFDGAHEWNRRQGDKSFAFDGTLQRVVVAAHAATDSTSS